MRMRAKTSKLQITMEYLLVFAFVIAIFIVLFAIIATRGSQLFSQQTFSQTQLVAQTVAQEINIAYNGGNGFSSNTILQSGYGINQYNITILKNGEVIVSANQGGQKIQSIAFSQARNIYAPGALPTNAISTQNFFGLVCVDISCPSPSNYSAAVSMQSQSVHVARFNGQSSYIGIPSNSALSPTTSLTVSAWVYPYSLNPSVQTQIVMNMNSAENEGYELTVHTSNAITFEYASSGCTGGYCNSPQYTVPAADAWYFVTGTYDGSNVHLYINGKEQGTATTGSNMAASTAQTSIGAFASQPASFQPFNGSIVDVQVYDTALSASQVSALYSQGIGGSPVVPANIVGWWPLNGNAYDYSGNNNTGTAHSVMYPSVSQLGVNVNGAHGNPINSLPVGFSSSLGNFAEQPFYVNYTTQNGLSAAFVNQNFTNGLAAVAAMPYPGSAAEAKNLSAWWPLSGGFAKVQVPVTPPGIIDYVPVTLTNSQSSPTTGGFQQMLTVNSDTYNAYEASNLENVEFFYPNGTIVPSWLESGNSNTATGTVYWLRLAPAIAAHGSAVVYMGFASTLDNLLNNVKTGEAPQLSASYAEYDNGNAVFGTYTNFAGSSLPYNWKLINGTGTVSDGLTFGSTASTTGEIISNTLYNPQTTAVDLYGHLASATQYPFFGYSNQSQLPTWCPQYYIYPSGTDFGLYDSNCSTASSVTIATEDASFHVFSIWATSSSAYAMLDYGSETTNSGVGFVASTGRHIEMYQYSAQSGTLFLQWVRTRALPPGGVMPSASYGSLTPISQTAGSAYDISGSGNTGTTYDVSYLSSAGAIFNGQSSNVTTTNAIVTGTSSESISAWFELTSRPSGTSSGACIPASNNCVTLVATEPHGQAQGDAINIDNGTYGLSYGVYIGGSYHQVSCGACNLSLNAWYYVTGIYDGSYLYLYLNGQPLNKTAQAGAITQPTGPGYIGSSGPTQHFPGIISDVQVYKTALSTPQVWQLYSTGLPSYQNVTIPMSLQR